MEEISKSGTVQGSSVQMGTVLGPSGIPCGGCRIKTGFLLMRAPRAPFMSLLLRL